MREKSRDPVALAITSNWAQGVHLIKEITPFRICSSDECSLFCSAPALELFFSCDGARWIWVGFKMHQFVGIVLPSECASKAKRMFTRTSLQAVGDTDIQ